MEAAKVKGLVHTSVTVLLLWHQVFLDMVENYPTCLRVLVLAENAISPELQQQISDLLSEGEEDEDREAEAHGSSVTMREKPAWLPHSSKG